MCYKITKKNLVNLRPFTALYSTFDSERKQCKKKTLIFNTFDHNNKNGFLRKVQAVINLIHSY